MKLLSGIIYIFLEAGCFGMGIIVDVTQSWDISPESQMLLIDKRSNILSVCSSLTSLKLKLELHLGPQLFYILTG